MGTDTDTGFIVEWRAGGEPADGGRIQRWIAVELSESEAIGLVQRLHPEAELRVVDSGREILEQAVRMGLEAGTYRQI